MKLTFRKHEVKSLDRLQALVTEHAEALEPGCRIVAAGVNLGRSTVDLVGIDARRTPLLVALGFTADDEMLFRMLEAYAWCLEYPESVRRLVGDGRGGWPPRVVFVAERVREAFLRKLRLLKFPSAACFEFRCLEVNGSTGFYLDPVDTSASRSAVADTDGPAAPAAQTLGSGAPGAPRPTEPATAPEARHAARGPASAEARDEAPRWLELLTTPTELAALLPSAPEAPVEPAGLPPGEPAPGDRASGERQTPNVLEEPEVAPKGDLAPAWRKFLEKLTAGLDAAPASQVPEAGGARPPSDEGEGSSEAAALAPAVRPGRNGAAGDKRGLLDGVQFPASGELAPQWRRFLDRPSIDEGKIGAVREYLQREFPLCTVYEFFEFQRNAQVFQLQDGQGKVSQITTVALEFFDLRREAEIRPWLEKHRLAQAMRQAGQAGVFVHASGLSAEKR